MGHISFGIRELLMIPISQLLSRAKVLGQILPSHSSRF